MSQLQAVAIPKDLYYHEVAYVRGLEAENAKLRAMLTRYMDAYPAFRIKPIGAPGSPARIEQENLMALEEQASALLLQHSERP